MHNESVLPVLRLPARGPTKQSARRMEPIPAGRFALTVLLRFFRLPLLPTLVRLCGDALCAAGADDLGPVFHRHPVPMRPRIFPEREPFVQSVTECHLRRPFTSGRLHNNHNVSVRKTVCTIG